MSSFSELEEFFNETWGGNERCLKNLSLKTNEMILNIQIFNNANGFGYGMFDMYFDDYKVFNSADIGKYSFVYFNTGNSSVCMNYEKNSTNNIFKPNDAWIGVIKEPFKGKVTYERKKRFKSQCIFIDNELISDFPLFNEINSLEPASIKTSSTNLTQKLILQDLENSHIYKGKMREIFIEAKILEMIYKSFSACDNYECCKGLNLCEHDIAAIKKAREILLKNMSNPPSIKELAKICAINEFKLKKGFKQHFNNTIYGMLQEERLKNAKELLMRNDVSVKEAASIVGYRSLAHFSKIFKEKFNVLPMEISKHKKFWIKA
ncbi:AraC family transcriptional regulator [Campylobacter sp. RM16190]|uniref:helix-turn-helix transcriptional regulator n=1 Tax=Campylobacter sp. RM16190 TaxID=1705727 RepID=UPI0014758911|nr:AraC family transcriptional regulator [Campylobacter sp. RM16190]